MAEKINAFHPDYIRTYHPDFLTDLRVESRQTKNGQAMTNHVNKVRKTKPSHGTVFGISNKVVSATAPAEMRKAKIKVVSTSVTEFHIYQRAAAPKSKSQHFSDIVAKKRQTNKNYGTMLPNSKNIPKNIPKNA